MNSSPLTPVKTTNFPTGHARVSSDLLTSEAPPNSTLSTWERRYLPPHPPKNSQPLFPLVAWLPENKPFLCLRSLRIGLVALRADELGSDSEGGLSGAPGSPGPSQFLQGRPPGSNRSLSCWWLCSATSSPRCWFAQTRGCSGKSGREGAWASVPTSRVGGTEELGSPWNII